MTGLPAHIRAIGQHAAGLRCIAEIRVEDFFTHAGDVALADQREEDLDAVIEIPLHQVGASEVDFFIAAVVEVKDAAVFKESTDDAENLDVFAHSGDAGPQRANTAHQQLHANAGL